MGLNLKIKRIIFSSLQKITKDGRKAHIADHEIRQIGGRAGRYKENGRIACMKTSDLLFVKSAFKELNIKPVKSLFKQKMEEEEENLLFSDLNERFRSAKAANETSQKLITRMFLLLNFIYYFFNEIIKAQYNGKIYKKSDFVPSL